MKIIVVLLSCAVFWVASHIDVKHDGYRSYSLPAQNVAVEAPVSPPYTRKQHEIQTTPCVNSHTREHCKGELVGSDEVRYWASKYWSGQDLDIAVALTVPEGQRDLYCIGDETAPYYGQPTNDGRHYGYSVGLYQWRNIVTGKQIGRAHV